MANLNLVDKIALSCKILVYMDWVFSPEPVCLLAEEVHALLAAAKQEDRGANIESLFRLLLSFLPESTEGSNARACGNHDHRFEGIWRQLET